VEIEFDPVKAADTLRERGLDVARVGAVFDGRVKTAIDDRFDYGEVRYATYGWMEQVAVAVVWTERNGVRRVISMRRMHQWEIEHVGLD
jgi:uncharacterized DUF497 family protein